MTRLLSNAIWALLSFWVFSSCQKAFDVPLGNNANGSSSNADSITYNWSLTTQAYPGLRDFEAGSFVINHTAYTLDIQGNLWSIDSGSTSWKQKASLPFPTPPQADGYYTLSYPVVFSIGNKGYVTCGHLAFRATGLDDQGSSTTLWEYEAASDHWTLKSSFPGTARIMPVAAGLSDNALVGLGISQVDSVNTASSFLRYTASSDTWTEAPKCSTDIVLGAAFNASGKAWLIGDKPLAGSSADHDNRLYHFDDATNSWQEQAKVGSTNDWFTFATVYGQKAYAITTHDNSSTLTSINLTTGAVTTLSTLPVTYSTGNTSFLFQLNGTLYLGELLQKKIWTCKLG